jgi:hypothetical protein
MMLKVARCRAAKRCCFHVHAHVLAHLSHVAHVLAHLYRVRDRVFLEIAAQRTFRRIQEKKYIVLM